MSGVQVTDGRVTTALLGIVGLVAAVVVFALLLRSDEAARRFGLLPAGSPRSWAGRPHCSREVDRGRHDWCGCAAFRDFSEGGFSHVRSFKRRGDVCDAAWDG